MLLHLSADQEYFRETTASFLNDLAPLEGLRTRRDDPVGYDPKVWTRGADLGWTSFLVEERHGGGSISGSGIADLAIVAYEFGRHASPGPLTPANISAGALSAADTGADLLGELLTGTGLASWSPAGPGPDGSFAHVTLTAELDGDDLVVDGVQRPMESAGQAAALLVTGRSGAGLTQVLVPADAPGVTVTPMRTLDLSRRFSLVTFDHVRVPISAVLGEVGQARAAVEQQMRHALVLNNAESVGAMQSAFDITVTWAFDRYSFGRPLASYQALKHRFADMKAWLEAAQAISQAATAAVATHSAQADSLLSAAKAFIGDYGGELMQECVQLHGGLGVTFEHDIHIFLRRQTVNRALLGTPAEHRLRLTALAELEEVPA